MSTELHLSIADPSDLSGNEIDAMHDLLTDAYARTEAEIWGENYVRIELAEYKTLIEKREIIIARLNDKIVGSIHVYPVDKETFGFGLLNVDLNSGKNGIGSRLIEAAEEVARINGAKWMKLEILRPANFEVQFKSWLANYYQKRGYNFLRTSSFIDIEPNRKEKMKRLITEVEFDTYQKVL